MKLPNWKKLFSKIHLRKRGQFKTIGEKANHDWKMAIIGFICLCIIIVISGLYMFIGVSEGSLFTVAQEKSANVQMIDQNSLDATIKFFQDRSTRLEDLKTNRPTTTDPSI